jgi:hypothetical protein
VVLFGYLVFIRTHGITECFGLLGEQIRDWQAALGPFHDLPGTGTRSAAGGVTLGPAFLWALWVVRVVIGPWFEYLPHAGGIGLSVLHSAADAFLFLALWKRFSSAVLALGVVLLTATSPFDMSLTATIWAPPLAVALVKCSVACVLWTGGQARAAADVTAFAFAWLALQVHSSALFFAAPVGTALVVRQFRDRGWQAGAAFAASIAAVILVLQLPYLFDRVQHWETSASPHLVLDSVRRTVAHPAFLRPVVSFRHATGAVAMILFRPWQVAWPGTLVTACGAIALCRLRRDPVLAAATVVPLAAAVVGYSLWQHDFQNYWFMVLSPGIAVAVGLAATVVRPAAPIAAALLVAVLVVGQPARSAEALTLHRLPEYGALLKGAREIKRRVAEVREIKLGFPVPPSTSPTFLYELLGGRIDPGAPYAATIHRDGRASFDTRPMNAPRP